MLTHGNLRWEIGISAPLGGSAKFYSKALWRSNLEISDFKNTGRCQLQDPLRTGAYGNRESQSDFARNVALLNELVRAGKPYDLLVVPNSCHGLHFPSTLGANSATYAT